jgi:hypothetical protein
MITEIGLVSAFYKYASHYRILVNDLALFAFTVRELRARTVNAGFGGASRRRNPLVENSARSQLANRSSELFW